ncbi:MAG: GNAT family N-acetyltransferase [Pseudooceanicola sp.]
MTLRIGIAGDLSLPHALRREIFIDEQAIPEAEEWDDLDAGADHLVAWIGEEPAGTLRLIEEGGTGRLTRICVRAPFRGSGLGAALVRDALDRLAARGVRRAELSAQVRARGFYERLGFAAEGAEYDDAGIPHVTMTLALPVPADARIA